MINVIKSPEWVICNFSAKGFTVVTKNGKELVFNTSEETAAFIEENETLQTMNVFPMELVN